MGMRTKFSKTYDNGEGTFTDEYSMSALHFLDGDGKWQDFELVGINKQDAMALSPDYS